MRALASACLLAAMGHGAVMAQGVVNTNVGSYTAKSGTATLVANPDANKSIIRLDSTKSILEWNRMNVAAGTSLEFVQPSSQSIVLNRILSADPTRIDGGLFSNGQVWLLNSSGVLFGANSQVNVQGLMATTRNIGDADFLAGRYVFGPLGNMDGRVANAGQIVAANGGYVVLAGSKVENSGRIQAQMGQVQLASGKAFAMDLNGDKLLRFDVTQALTGGDASEAAVRNAGQLIADGGQVQMTARAAQGLVGQVVNTGGLLQANSAREVNGEIVLDAGPGGEVIAGGQLSAQGLNAGQKGGNVTVVGEKITLPTDARINTSGQAGGGNVLVGGDWQGSGNLQQASMVDMQAGSQIQANATQAGDGGKVVLWSDVHKNGGTTSVAGAIQAQGGIDGGNGGKVETSGASLSIAKTAAVNAGSAKGLAGQWLLDPVNVTIDSAAASTIETALNSNYVLVTTTGTTVNSPPFTNVRVGESGTDGNIYVNAPMSWNKYFLSLEASGNVYINSPLTIGAINNSNSPGTFGGLQVVANSLNFGMNSNGFLGRIDIQDSAGAARAGNGFRFNNTNYTLINDVTGLQNISSGLSGNYALSGNIDLSTVANWSPLGTFTGRFNGLGHTVSNLTINRPGESNLGLFSVNTGSISAIGIASGSVAGGDQTHFNTGSLVGINYGGSISNVFSKADVTGEWQNVGGLVGFNSSSASVALIENSFSAGNVIGTNNLGGLVGTNQATGSADAIIRNSYVAGNVSSSKTVQNGIFIGGLAGINEGGVGAARIQNSYATGTVFTQIGLTGGLVGINSNSQSFITDSYATGIVRNTSAAYDTSGIGGLVGLNQGVIARTYATGMVSSPFNSQGEGTGGLVGSNYASVSDSYATGTVSAQFGRGDLIGIDGGSSTGSAAVTAANKFKAASYGNFDFANTWVIYEGSTAPLLRSFLTPMTVSVSNPTVATQVYDGTNAYSGSGTVSYSSFYSNPVAQTNGSVSYSLASKNVGTQQIQVGGLYSDQQGYLFTYANSMGSATVTPAPLTVTAGVVTKTYDGTTTATGSGTAGALAGAGASEYIASAGTQAFTNKNAGTGKTVQASGVTIKDSGNADVTSNYNITYVDNTASTINQASLTVGFTGVNKEYDGNTTARVTTNDNRITNDVLTLTATANFADDSIASNKPVAVTALSLGGVDAANYTLANTTGNTTADITASKTVQTPLQKTASYISSIVTAVQPPVASTASSSVTTTDTTVSSAFIQPTSSATTQATASGDGKTDQVNATNLAASQNAPVATVAAAPTTQAATTAVISVSASNITTQANQTTAAINANTSAANANTSAQVQMVSLNNTTSRITPTVGAQTIAPVETPKTAEDQRDPVLAAVSSFKPVAPATSSAGNKVLGKGRDAAVVVPLVQGVLVMETSPPKAATQAVDEQRLSASGDRSRW
jgi:filamentous hemagglutinin family protein